MTKDPLAAKTRAANAAFRRAAKRVLDIAEQTGTKVVIWKDGKIDFEDPKKMRREIFPTRKKKAAPATKTTSNRKKSSPAAKPRKRTAD